MDQTNSTASADSTATTSPNFEFSFGAPTHDDFASLLKFLVVLVTLSQTSLIALYRFFNPDQRWKTLCGMAMQMEKLIWTFRTCTGPFEKNKLVHGQDADDVLEEELEKWTQQLATSDIVSTALMKRYRLHHFQHGQYAHKSAPKSSVLYRQFEKQEITDLLKRTAKQRPEIWGTTQYEMTETLVEDENQQNGETEDRWRCLGHRCPHWCPGCCCSPLVETEIAVEYDNCDSGSLHSPFDRKHDGFENRDNHFSPVDATGYLKHRIGKKLRFYQKRIPKYNRWNCQFTGASGIVSFISAVFAMLVTPSSWPSSKFFVAILTAILTALMASSQYHDAENKLRRYNLALIDLKKLIAHWHTLTLMERNKLCNITQLVDRGESIILDEIVSWGVSSSQETNGMNNNGPTPAIMNKKRVHELPV